MKLVLRSLIQAIGVACGVGLLAMAAAWDHNPQGEFHQYEASVIHWGDWLSIGGGWALLALPVAWILCFLALIVYPTRPQTVGYLVGGVVQLLCGSWIVFHDSKNPALVLLGAALALVGIAAVVRSLRPSDPAAAATGCRPDP